MHTDGESQLWGIKRRLTQSKNRPPMDSSFPLSHALVPAPGLQTPLEKVEISSLPPLPPNPIHGKVRQCGSYYLISIPYSLRYFNDPLCFHGPGARSPLTHGRVTTTKKKKSSRRSLLPRWHPARRHPPGWRRRWSVFLPSQPTGIHYVSSFSICPFIFHCLEMSERPCVLPLPWLHECVPTDGRQGGHAVYCFRLHGVPDVTDGLVLRFPSLSPSLRVRSVRSLAAVSNDTPISSDPKQDNFF